MPTKHSVYDTDTHFSINPVTRALVNESLSKTSLIQFDHNSERFTFELPRVIEGHDMSLCDIIQVHYNNIDAQTKEESKGVYTVTDMQVSPDGDDVAIFSWLISSNATKFVGSLNFLIRLACTGDEGHVYYVWNTGINSSISVSSGIYNGEAVVEDYADVLEAWKKELESNQIVDIKQTTASTSDGGVNIWTAYFGDGRTSAFEVRNGSKGSKGDQGEPGVDGDGAVTVDSDFDPESTNPLQNGIITQWKYGVDGQLGGMSDYLGSVGEQLDGMNGAIGDIYNIIYSGSGDDGNIFTVTIPNTVSESGDPSVGWGESGDGYFRVLTVEGLTGNNFIADVVTNNGDAASNKKVLESWSHLQWVEVYEEGNNLLLFMDEVPPYEFQMILRKVK